MRLSELNAHKKSLSLEIDGESLNLTYRPHYLTSTVEAELQEFQTEASERTLRMLRIMCGIVISWDLTDDNDQPYPLDPQVLADAGLTGDVAAYVLNSILEDNSKVGEVNSGS